ncbi:hypothetical protein GOV08_00495 [Candidatus Woesearchaeota archaeon]|nr:hypothetical protein [Candidatus Woesearchaeota archaeon]
MHPVYIYLSYNKVTRYIKRLLSDNNIDTSRIKFITCVKEAGEQEDGATDVFVHPGALTDISINISTLMEKIPGEKFILVDTISSFSIYHDTENIIKFISNTNSKMSSKSGIIWVAVTDESAGLASKIAPLCNKVIEINNSN